MACCCWNRYDRQAQHLHVQEDMTTQRCTQTHACTHTRCLPHMGAPPAPVPMCKHPHNRAAHACMLQSTCAHLLERKELICSASSAAVLCAATPAPHAKVAAAARASVCHCCVTFEQAHISIAALLMLLMLLGARSCHVTTATCCRHMSTAEAAAGL